MIINVSLHVVLVKNLHTKVNVEQMVEQEVVLVVVKVIVYVLLYINQSVVKITTLTATNVR